jgi:hypothetical protein
LKDWNKNLNSDAKSQLHMANEVILRLDIAQETRSLSPAELNLRNKLKKKVMGLAVIERARCKQASRITNIKMGNANTKFFHHRVNARRRKNHIQRLRKGHGWAVKNDEKATVVQEHFTNVMSRPPVRHHDLNWEELQIPSHDLESLAAPFTEKL